MAGPQWSGTEILNLSGSTSNYPIKKFFQVKQDSTKAQLLLNLKQQIMHHGNLQYCFFYTIVQSE